MTYGWTILTVAVVIAGLYFLGIFRIGNTSPNLCTPIAPYSCSNPVLLSNGILMVQVQELGSTVTVTGLGCSNSNAAPSSFSPVSTQLFSGVPSSLSFTCNLQSPAIGASFSGTLWVQYGSGAQTGISQISTVNAKVLLTGVAIYSFSATSGTGGYLSCSPSCSGNYPVGTPITLTATPFGTNTFNSWTGTYSNSLISWSFNMPANPLTEIASFNICYPLTLAYGAGGASATASPANSVGCSTGYFLQGATPVITATPSTNYAFGSWAGTSSSNSNPWTFTMPASTATETASFVYPCSLLTTSTRSYTSSITATINYVIYGGGGGGGGAEYGSYPAGTAGGAGATSSGSFAVSPGSTLVIYAGGGGGGGGGDPGNCGGTCSGGGGGGAGYPSGGDGGYGGQGGMGGNGGTSAILVNGATIASAAGGAGGACSSYSWEPYADISASGSTGGHGGYYYYGTQMGGYGGSPSSGGAGGTASGSGNGGGGGAYGGGGGGGGFGNCAGVCSATSGGAGGAPGAAGSSTFVPGDGTVSGGAGGSNGVGGSALVQAYTYQGNYWGNADDGTGGAGGSVTLTWNSPSPPSCTP